MLTQSQNSESPSMTGTNRRREDRRDVDLLVNRFLNGYPYLCRATDISRTGMRVVPLHEPTTKTRFMGLQFQLPGSSEVVTASGEVVFAAEEGGAVGVRFTRLPQESLEQIGRFVARQE
jgi:hypothetical protein